MNKNSITIVIATYNCDKELQFTLDNIRLFKNTYIKLAIIDGKSKDSTVEVIKKNIDIVDYFISEPDNGIYSAWNKSIKFIKTDFFMFLGAGDTTTKEFINEFQDFQNASSIDIFFGNFYYIEDKNTAKLVDTTSYEKKLAVFLRSSMCVAHPGLIHNSKLLKNNIFNENYKICSDWFFLYEANVTSTIHINKIQCYFKTGGISSRFNSRPIIFKEILKFLLSKNKIPSKRHIIDIIVYYLFFTSEKFYYFTKQLKEKK